MTDLKDLLLRAPINQIDAPVRNMINHWSSPPTALQVLEVLDNCVAYASCSTFVLRVLSTMFTQACKAEGLRESEVEAKATWRKK